jgi:hypothetical protein
MQARRVAGPVVALGIGTDAVRGSEPPDLAARAAAVLEAVFRQQIDFWLDANTRAGGTGLYLAIDPGGAPRSVGKEGPIIKVPAA